MIGFLLGLLAYSLYLLLVSEDGPALAMGMARLSLVFVLILAVRTNHSLLLGGVVFLTAIVLVGAMGVLRKEVQLDHESE